MMSGSAPRVTSPKMPAVASVITLIAIAWVVPARGQDNSVPAAQVVAMVARLRTNSLAQVGSAEALSLGQRLLIEQRYGEATELFGAVLEKWPREPVALYGAALAAFNLGRIAQAEPLVRTAAELYLAGGAEKATPESVSTKRRLSGADALVLLAVILGARGDDSEALKTAERAVAIAPDHFDAQFTLGRAFYGSGDFAGAAKAFRAALKLKPDDAKALFFLATTLEGAGESEAALNAYRELVQRQPQAAEGHLGLGVLLIKRGGAKASKGIAELQTAVRIDPNLYEGQVTLGRALLTEKLAAEAVEHLQRAAELSPTNPEPHYQLALAYRRLGLSDKAAAETAIVKRIHESRRGDGAQPNPAKPEK
jgi:tetratricopeptide (TPR) repeat protein